MARPFLSIRAPRFPLIPIAACLFLAAAAHADDPYSGEPGSLDLHFGEWGLGLAGIAGTGSSSDSVTAIGTDSAGRILAAGAFCEVPGLEGCYPIIMRFTANGRRDHDWGDDGIVLLAPDALPLDIARIAIAAADNDGWWASWRAVGSSTRHLVKLASTGGFIPGFAPGDLAVEQPAAVFSRLHQIERASGGDRLLAITRLSGTGEEADTVAISRRLAGNGNVDTTFGNGSGTLLIPLNLHDTLTDSAVLPDGRVAVLVTQPGFGIDRLLVAEENGSGLDMDFGNGGSVEINDLLTNALTGTGIAPEGPVPAGIGLSAGGEILLGMTFSDSSGSEIRDRAMVIAIDGTGARSSMFGNGLGYALHGVAEDFLFATAFAVNPKTGDSVLDAWGTPHGLNARFYFTSDGKFDAHYGRGTAVIRDVKLPANNPIFSTTITYDSMAGVLSNGFSTPDSILGMNTFGVLRFLAPGEIRSYDARPDTVSDFTWPSSVPAASILELGRFGFPGRDVAITLAVDNGRIGGEGDRAEDYVDLPAHAVIPTGLDARIFHRTAEAIGSLTTTTVTIGTGGTSFQLHSRTGVDRSPDPITFQPANDVAPESFIVSGPGVIAGIDEPVDVRVDDNSCYFLLEDVGALPDAAITADNCITEIRQASRGNVILLAHVSASEPDMKTATVLHYGDNATQFVSVTRKGDESTDGPGNSDSPGDDPGDDTGAAPGDEPEDPANGGGPLGPIALLALLLMATRQLRESR